MSSSWSSLFIGWPLEKSAKQAFSDNMLGTSAWPIGNNMGSTEVGAKITIVSSIFRISAWYYIIFSFSHSGRTAANRPTAQAESVDFLS